MDRVLIRLVNETDLDRLCDLYLEFHNFHARHLPASLRVLDDPPSDLEREELRHKIQEIIHGKDSAILVAELSSQVIGLAEVYLHHPDPDERAVVPTLYAHLQSLAVTRKFQRRGVGIQLLHAAQSWGSEHGATELRLDIWEFSAGPLGFYEKLGYHTTRRTLVKKL